MANDIIKKLLLEVNKFILEELTDATDMELLKMVVEKRSRQADDLPNSHKRIRKYLDRKREDEHMRLFLDYFSNKPNFLPDMFKRRFRMNKELFNRIVAGISNHYVYFRMRDDVVGKKGLSPIQKCTAAIRQLAYGTPADHYDEYIRIGETIVVDCLKLFCRCVIEVFGEEYLRKPNASDVQRLLQLHSEYHGFPGMLGSIDCMHWAWKNCPNAWKCQFTRGDQGVPTIMLEAVASQDLWIWHAFFGVAGSNNDINVLNQSPLFEDVLQGNSPKVHYTVNGTTYTKAYYLADGIYPEWATIVKTFPHPQDAKINKFKKMQEAARKDVERAFGVLQSRWAIIRGAARFWYPDTMSDIIYACIILHNMIVENEGNAISSFAADEVDDLEPVTQGPIEQFHQYLQKTTEVRDRLAHQQLRSDLIEHIWGRFGDDEEGS